MVRVVCVCVRRLPLGVFPECLPFTLLHAPAPPTSNALRAFPTAPGGGCLAGPGAASHRSVLCTCKNIHWAGCKGVRGQLQPCGRPAPSAPCPPPSSPAPRAPPPPSPPLLTRTRSPLTSHGSSAAEGGSHVDFSKQGGGAAGGGGGAASGALSGLLRGAGDEAAGALAGAMRRLGVGEAAGGGSGGAAGSALGPTSGLQYSDLAPLVGSYGTRLPGRGVTLATSFRDPHQIPLQPMIREEAEAGVEENSDDEWAARAAQGIGARQKSGRGAVVLGSGGAHAGAAGEDSSDDEGSAPAAGAGRAAADEDEGVFGDLH